MKRLLRWIVPTVILERLDATEWEYHYFTGQWVRRG